VFELKVRVGPHDRARLDDQGTVDDDAEAPFVDQEEATEIFVPLLHFAKDDVVKRAFGVPVTPSRAGQKIISDAPPTPGTVPLPASIPLLTDASTLSLSMDSTKARALDQTSEMNVASGGGSSCETSLEQQEEVIGTEMEDALDLEVVVNAGRWAIEGEVLKKWQSQSLKHKHQAPTFTGRLTTRSFHMIEPFTTQAESGRDDQIHDHDSTAWRSN
jgi:hypothetical protein